MLNAQDGSGYTAKDLAAAGGHNAIVSEMLVSLCSDWVALECSGALQRLADKRQLRLADEFSQKYEVDYSSVENSLDVGGVDSEELDLEDKATESDVFEDVQRRTGHRVNTRKAGHRQYHPALF